jgi:predicted amidohydrolase YtcJ
MPRHPPTDLILLAPRIHLLGDRPPVRALLLRGGRVAAAGDPDTVRGAALAGARTLEVDGVVTPGLTDAHVHLTTWALARRRVDLHAASTAEEGGAMVARAAAAGGDGWVRGLGWDRNRWGGLPHRQVLDRVVPGRPVHLLSHDIHAAWLNTEALLRCGITAETPDPPGGAIVRDPDTGAPTGVLLEHAVALAEPHLPVDSPAEVRAALLEAQAELHRLGLTGVHSVEVTGLEDFAALEQDGLLRLRVLQAIPLVRLEAAIEVGLRSGFGSDRLRVGGVKMFLDGALGSRTAWMREPYEGSDDRGIRTLEPAAFRDAVQRAAAAGIATTVHAIGDAAVELAIDVLSRTPRPAALPHRIEHVQLCPPELWDAMGRSGVVASMQPVHLLTDVPAVERHWGAARARGAYAFGPLARAGAVLAFGSDAPVETPDPRQGLFAAVRRVARDGSHPGAWHPENAVDAEAALRAYTEGPAAAAGVEATRGRLLPGCDADLVAWDRDPLGCDPEALPELRCLLTMVAGEVVHRSDG